MSGDQDTLTWGDMDTNLIALKHSVNSFSNTLQEEPTPENLRDYLKKISSYKERLDCVYRAFFSAMNNILDGTQDYRDIDVEEFGH